MKHEQYQASISHLLRLASTLMMVWMHSGNFMPMILCKYVRDMGDLFREYQCMSGKEDILRSNAQFSACRCGRNGKC